MERHIKVKVIYDAHESQKRKAHCFMPCCAMLRGPHWRRAMGVSSAKQVGRTERERERICGQVPLLGVRPRLQPKR